MESKVCFKCGILKSLSDYYTHPQMGDGHLNKCKDCTKADTKSRVGKLIEEDVSFIENEKARHRRKYHRLKYKDLHKPTPEQKKATIGRYQERFPEKEAARTMSSALKPPFFDAEKHHWSYNDVHFKDVLWLTIKDHQKAHRFLIYDQEQKMYRRYDTNELLDTKDRHENFILECIKTKED